jgi:hypothetical protein
MATDYSAVSDLNSLFAQIYEEGFFVNRQTELLTRLVKNATARTMAPRNLPKYTKHSAATVAEGEAPVKTKLVKTNAGTITPVIYHHIVPLTDERIMTDPDEARQAAAREGGMAITEKIEVDGVAKFASFTASAGAAATALSLSACAVAMTKLHAASARGVVNFVLHPYEWHNLLKEIVDLGGNPASAGNEVANEAMRQYFVSKYMGANWYLNTAIDPDDTNTIVGAAFTADAMIWDERTPLTLEAERAATVRGWDLNFVVRGGWGVNNVSNGVKLLGPCTEPS